MSEGCSLRGTRKSDVGDRLEGQDGSWGQLQSSQRGPGAGIAKADSYTERPSFRHSRLLQSLRSWAQLNLAKRSSMDMERCPLSKANQESCGPPQHDTTKILKQQTSAGLYDCVYTGATVTNVQKRVLKNKT